MQASSLTQQIRLLSFAAALVAATASAQTLGNPMGGLEKFKNYETQRASSCDPNIRSGNADARPIAPGATLTVAELQGPGKIMHIWVTIAHEDPYYSRMLTLRMYWDGEEHPSVECPIGDFFGIGHGIDRPFSSLPIRVTSDGKGRNCYWPMPFRKSARITVTNESKKPCHAFYYYVDWQKHKKIGDDEGYFHAFYRQEYPCVMGKNYLLADIQGKGHYVGTVQSVFMISPGWYGEGDDFFYIDGETEPRLRGTGTEDYFCDGWGFREQSGPFYGTPVWEGYDTGDRGTAYRFHLTDPIVFNKSLRAEIEHKGSQTFPDGKGDGFIERDDLMSSVAFWYQNEPHKAWPALPAGADRLAFVDGVLLAGYKAVPSAKHSEGPVEVQDIGGATDGKQLWFRPSDDQAWLETSFDVNKEQTIQLMGKVIHSWDYGIYKVLLDGKQIAQHDFFEPFVATRTHKWGTALATRKAVYSRDPSIDLRSLQKK